MRVGHKRTRRGKHRSRRLSYGEACAYVEREISKYRFAPWQRDLILEELYDTIGGQLLGDGVPRHRVEQRIMEALMQPGRVPLLYRPAIDELLRERC